MDERRAFLVRQELALSCNEGPILAVEFQGAAVTLMDGVKVTESLTVLKLIHDLKSPLGALKILDMKAKLEPEHRQVLRLAVSFLDSLVNSACRANSVDLYGQELERLLSEIIAEKRAVCDLRRISLTIQGSSCIKVGGNAFDFRRVVGNIISNALQASENENPVDVTLILAQDHAQVICRNFGSGPKRPGWGMGLSIVRETSSKCGWLFDLETDAHSRTEATLILK